MNVMSAPAWSREVQKVCRNKWGVTFFAIPARAPSLRNTFDISLRPNRRGLDPVVTKSAGCRSVRMATNRLVHSRQRGDRKTVRCFDPFPRISTSLISPAGASVTTLSRESASEMRMPVDNNTSIRVRRRRPLKLCVGTTSRNRVTSSLVGHSGNLVG